MKKLFTDNSYEIQDELDRLARDKVVLFCGRRIKMKMGLGKLPIHGTTKSPAGDLLVLHHPHEPSCSNPTCVFYYHAAGKPLRLFECTRKKKVEDFLGLEYPAKIFDIQRRQFDRVGTAHNSSATFCLQGKQRMHHFKVGDVSLEGAKITGEIHSVLSKGSIVSPLTLTLFRRFDPGEETKLHVPEATVMWAIVKDGRTVEMGLKFSLPDQARGDLSDYINLRSLEG